MKSVLGNAALADPEDPLHHGEMVVNFPNGPEFHKANYIVVDSDYGNYSIVYNCKEALLLKTGGMIIFLRMKNCFNICIMIPEMLFLLTRDQQPSQELVDWAYG